MTKRLRNPMKWMGVTLLAVAFSSQTIAADFALDKSPVEEGSSNVVASYAEVLEPGRAAVVSVTTASIVETMRSGNRINPMEEFMRRFYGIPTPPQGNQSDQGEMPRERRIPNGLGSGVIVSADGYILTNNHVVTDEQGETADEITVHLNNGNEVKAELIGRDERTDVALLKIDRKGLPFLQMADSDRLKVGDVVFAIGNPLGVGQTCTMGIVSATKRTNLGLLGSQGYEDFIQTDAAINRGNSGGALVDAKGRLVGINTAIYSQTGGNIGIGFAIPTSLARTVILELIENGTVRRGYLGISIRDLDMELAEAFGLDSSEGVLVETVQEGTPADKAGIKRGDVIRSVDGTEVETVSDLRLKVASIRPGVDTTVEVSREGETKLITVTLGSLDDPNAVVSTEDSPLEGVGLEPTNPDSRRQWNIEEENGIIVTEVSARSAYSNTLAPGMVILEVNDTKVTTIGELSSALKSGRVNKLWVSFRGNKGFVALRVQ